MEKEFLSYKESLELKELGFDESCFGYYDGNHNLQYMFNGKPENFTKKRMGVSNSVLVGWISAPLYQQAFRWFREKYPNLYFGIGKIYNGTSNYHFHINLQWEFFEGTYEEAELACIRKLIELAKEQNVK